MKTCLRSLLAVLGFMPIIIFVAPVQAATRNDFLFNLKDAFNSSAASKFTVTGIIVTLAVVILLALFFYYFSSEQNVQRTARNLQREKIRRQMAASKPIASSQQDRKWYRLKTRAEFKWIPIDQVPKVRENRYKVDHLIDISGGGIGFSTHEKLNSGDQIRIILSTGNDEPLLLNAQVNRVVEDNDIHKVSAEFIDIRDGNRDKIVSWIINRQRLAIHGEKPEEHKLGNGE